MLSEVIHLLASIINFLVKGLVEGDYKQGSKEFMCLVRSYFPSSVIRSKVLLLLCTFFAFNCCSQSSLSHGGRQCPESTLLNTIFS